MASTQVHSIKNCLLIHTPLVLTLFTALELADKKKQIFMAPS